MAVISYREALNQAMREEMERDPNVFVMGEEVGHYNGAYKVTQGLLQRFSERRIGLDHIAIGVPAAEVGRLAGVLDAAGVLNSGVKVDPMGPTMLTFRDPDNIQWELFEQP